MVEAGLWRPKWASAGECVRPKLENLSRGFCGFGDIEQEIPKQCPSCTVVSFWTMVKRTFGLAPYKHGLDDLMDDHCLIQKLPGLTGDRAEWLTPCHPPSDFACAKPASSNLVMTFQSSTLALVWPSCLGVLERCIWMSHMLVGFDWGADASLTRWKFLEFQSLKLRCSPP